MMIIVKFVVSPTHPPPPHHSPRCSHLGSSLVRSWQPFVDLYQCDCPSHKVRDHCGLLRLGPFSAGSESHPRPQIRLPRRGRRRRDGTPLIASQLPPWGLGFKTSIISTAFVPQIPWISSLFLCHNLTTIHMKNLTSSPSRILWIDSWMSASWQISDSVEEDGH